MLGVKAAMQHSRAATESDFLCSSEDLNPGFAEFHLPGKNFLRLGNKRVDELPGGKCPAERRCLPGEESSEVLRSLLYALDMKWQGQAVLQWEGRHLPIPRSHFLDETVDDSACGTAGESTGESRAVVTSLLQHLAVYRTGGGFRTQEKGRAHLNAAGTEDERGRDPAAICDAAGGNDRDGDGVDNLWHEGKSADIADFQRFAESSAMTTGIAALGDNCVYAPSFQ